MFNLLQRRDKSYDKTPVYGHCASRQYISAECRYSGRPSKHSLQNATTLQLAVSQPICGADVMCRPAHARPVLPFVLCANNCQSEHIHRMLLSNVAVTTERHQGKYIGLSLVKSFILNFCHFSFSQNLKITPNFLIMVRL